MEFQLKGSKLFLSLPLLTIAHKHNRYAFKSSSSYSHSTPSTTATTSSSFLEDPFQTGRFLSKWRAWKAQTPRGFQVFSRTRIWVIMDSGDERKGDGHHNCFAPFIWFRDWVSFGCWGLKNGKFVFLFFAFLVVC